MTLRDAVLHPKATDRSAMGPARAVLATLILAPTLLACTPDATDAQEHEVRNHEFRVTTVVDGLEHPWGMAFLPDGDILVTERPGRLRIVRSGTLDPEPIAGVPDVFAQGQGGLLDVALHPDFDNNRLVYLSYAKPLAEGATTAVSRGRLEDNHLADVEEIFVANAQTTRGVHFGSRLVFDRDGYLFVSIGDRGIMQEAQNTANHQGTVLRLHDDGRVPSDNPFVGESGAEPEIYAYGIRNPQGMTLHPETGELWESEHGPRGGDEINLIQPGRNYGWPTITHGIDYDGSIISEDTARAGMEQPLHYWDPSIASSGIAIYDGDRFPGWRGDVFVGGLAGQQLARVSFDGTTPTGEETLLKGEVGRIRDVRSGPDGYVYLLIDQDNAPMLRLEPVDD